MRLIDADAALDRYYAEYETQDICDGSEDRDWLKKCYDDAPTIDPESLRKKGEWKPRTDVVGFVNCSVCHECNIYDDWADGKKWNFCPNCAADMRGDT